jgi:hypothetical protein
MFGVRHEEIVVVDRATGTTAHLFPHKDMTDLVDWHRDGAGIDITDTNGTHYYPAAAVLGLHFQTAPNYTDAHVELWQDNYGIGKAGEDGAAQLYLVDPDHPDKAWPIHPSWLTSRANFRTVAEQLVDGSLQLVDLTYFNVPTSSLTAAQCAATWRHQGGLVEIAKEQRGGMPGRQPVAGRVAAEFIGLEDMNADARR